MVRCKSVIERVTQSDIGPQEEGAGIYLLCVLSCASSGSRHSTLPVSCGCLKQCSTVALLRAVVLLDRLSCCVTHGRVDAVACFPRVWRTGERLNKFWRQQRLYDPNVKPWGKAMANMLEEDPLFLASRAAQPSNTFTLLLGQLIESGAKVRVLL